MTTLFYFTHEDRLSVLGRGPVLEVHARSAVRDARLVYGALRQVGVPKATARVCVFRLISAGRTDAMDEFAAALHRATS